MGERVFHVSFVIEIPEDSGWIFKHEGEDVSDFALARRLTDITLEQILSASTAQVDWQDENGEHLWHVDVENGRPRYARKIEGT